MKSKSKKYTEKTVFLIGLIASIITIYVFLSGKVSIVDHKKKQGAIDTPERLNKKDNLTINDQLVSDSEGNQYRTIRLIGKIWLRENLACVVPGSHCREQDSVKCNILGRLYTWHAAKEVCKCIGDEWRVPSEEEWKALAGEYGEYYSVDNIDKYEGKSTYSALIDGGNTGFDAIGSESSNDIVYWSSTEDTYFGNSTGINFEFDHYSKHFARNDSPKSRVFHVRCLHE